MRVFSCHNACLSVSYYKNSGAAMDMKDAATQGHCALNPVAFEEKKYALVKAETPKKVAVIGGGLTGCEIAYDLALKGKEPVIVEMTDELVKAIGICAANSECLRDLMRYHKVETWLESTLKEIKDGSILISTKDGEKEIACDSVVLSVGYVSDQSLMKENEHVHILGDADKVGNLKKSDLGRLRSGDHIVKLWIMKKKQGGLLLFRWCAGGTFL